MSMKSGHSMLDIKNATGDVPRAYWPPPGWVLITGFMSVLVAAVAWLAHLARFF